MAFYPVGPVKIYYNGEFLGYEQLVTKECLKRLHFSQLKLFEITITPLPPDNVTHKIYRCFVFWGRLYALPIDSEDVSSAVPVMELTK